MKAEILRNLLDLALNRCFEAGERKSSECITKLEFKNDVLNLSTKGSFTYYEEKVPILACDESFSICLKTAHILDFVKYVSSDKVIVAFSKDKNSCVLSADNKTKLALQTVDQAIEDLVSPSYDCEFTFEDSNEFSNKLKCASKFCSANFQDHPLTAIHCSLENDSLCIKATSGPSFYQSSLLCRCTQSFDFYIHQKSHSIIKNIFNNFDFTQCYVNKNHLLLKNDFSSLKIFLESANSSFPTQVTDWLDKQADCTVKVSTYELSKSLKFLNDIFNNPAVSVKCLNNKLSLECLESNSASKDFINIEESNGQAESKYSVKLFADCLDALNSPWVNLNFIKMSYDFYLCKITSEKTITLICPISS
jgi:DNA polymerase III sliding clamp (beta) subunit (PCNA family)